LEVQDENFALTLNARTLAIAESAGVDTIVNVCSTCQLKLASDNLRLRGDLPLRQKVNRALAKIGLEYDGNVEITHLLYVLLDDIGLEMIRAQTKRPLDGLRVAPFYGCHLLRPAEVHGYREDPYQPRSLAVLIEALGGIPVHYPGEIKCCGFHSLVIKQKPAVKMSANHLIDAKRGGADIMVTPCPLCFTVLDGYQFLAEKELGEKINLPILHLPQLVGLAMGLLSEEMGLERHMVDPRRVLDSRLGN
jgi:succinate dehydrogenase / fumarate reductase cytochrome b subunit